ncbi:SET domain-containing protein [Patellaria atrata CBS 101060]|uniref:SET domain-containing protein n=1 Tax=Patellaria atrata CBS 101060 TaxID=1346257 RepID=A0A9P4S1A2_9PEZI|nr:SET domain-containing protein [Patellaria atrata CBS 101060]
MFKSKTLLHDKRPTFYPCNHVGNCEANLCSCYGDNVVCEKHCCCARSCSRRFKGCRCIAKGRRVCWMDDNCDCYRLNRECDPDLCGSCGVVDALDPTKVYEEPGLKTQCSNCALQRGVPSRLLTGISEVQGFGLYTGEPIKANQFLGEYKGEVLARIEGERRLVIYQHLKANYLFKLNEEQDIDAARMGNKTRFINNSKKEDTINCYPKVLLCNTEARIGLFAKKDLQAGEELFFDYGCVSN